MVREQRIDKERRSNEQNINRQEDANKQSAEHELCRTFSIPSAKVNRNLKQRRFLTGKEQAASLREAILLECGAISPRRDHFPPLDNTFLLPRPGGFPK
jgi:hypothetical protein